MEISKKSSRNAANQTKRVVDLSSHIFTRFWSSWTLTWSLRFGFFRDWDSRRRSRWLTAQLILRFFGCALVVALESSRRVLCLVRGYLEVIPPEAAAGGDGFKTGTEMLVDGPSCVSDLNFFVGGSMDFSLTSASFLFSDSLTFKNLPPQSRLCLFHHESFLPGAQFSLRLKINPQVPLHRHQCLM